MKNQVMESLQDGWLEKWYFLLSNLKWEAEGRRSLNWIEDTSPSLHLQPRRLQATSEAMMNEEEETLD